MGPNGIDRRSKRPWSLGRRADDRKWPRFLRDLWILAATGIALIGVLNSNSTAQDVATNQQSTLSALCALRSDLETRVQSGNDFLSKHPGGIPGIPVATIRASNANEERTIIALSPLPCPKPKHH